MQNVTAHCVLLLLFFWRYNSETLIIKLVWIQIQYGVSTTWDAFQLCDCLQRKNKFKKIGAKLYTKIGINLWNVFDFLWSVICVLASSVHKLLIKLQYQKTSHPLWTPLLILYKVWMSDYKWKIMLFKTPGKYYIIQTKWYGRYRVEVNERLWMFHFCHFIFSSHFWRVESSAYNNEARWNSRFFLIYFRSFCLLVW